MTQAGESADELDGIVARLAHEDPGERVRAEDELLRRGREGVPAALRALEDVLPGAAERTAELVRRLASKVWKERAEAARELARLGRHARPHLAAHEKSGDPEVAWRIRAILAEIQERREHDSRLEEARAAALCRFLGEAGDARAVAPLLKVVGSGSDDLALGAAEALGKLRDSMDAGQAVAAADRALELLGKAKTLRSRGLLLRTLGRLRSPACVRPLVRLLADSGEKDVRVKQNCMAALLSVGDEKGVRAVVEALEGEDVYVRAAAAALLEEASGGSIGYDPRASVDANREAVAKLRAWWSRKFGREWSR